jgi:phage/plasmid-like protein (TIGR03299 family)
MSHLVQTMAYRNEVPWHGLGNRLQPNQPLETWLVQAGMNWQIIESPVLFNTAIATKRFPQNKVLFRSDSHVPLAVVSNRYKVVQPREVLEFYRDLVATGGFELETAGVLKEGKKLWALAKTGQETVLKGGDQVKAYLLMATACDGTLATTCQFTSIRVVCNNTLSMAVGNVEGAIKVPHSTRFDAKSVKEQLGLGGSIWVQFMDRMRDLSDRKVNVIEAKRYLVEVLGDPNVPLTEQPNAKAIDRTFELFSGQGKGAMIPAAKGTAWGLLNSITELIDHERKSRSMDNRLDSAWFGIGAAIKKKAFEEALKLAA